MAEGDACLLDSNILLRISKSDDPQYFAIDHTGQAIRLSDAQAEAILVERTGGGVPEFAKRLRSVAESHALPDQHMKRMAERDFEFLPDGQEVHDRWRSLLIAHNIQGVQVHDARLAASMYVHGIEQLLTINVRDFRRFDGLRILHPAELSGTS